MANPTIKAKAVLDTTQFSSSLNKLQHDLNGLTKAVPGLGNAIGLLKNPITLTVGALAGLGKMFAQSAVYGDSFARACGMWDGALQGFQNILTNFDFSNFLEGMRDAIELGGDLADTFDNLETERSKKNVMSEMMKSEIQEYERQYRLNVQNGMSRKEAAKLYNQQIESLEPRFMEYVNNETEASRQTIAKLIKKVVDAGSPDSDKLAKELKIPARDRKFSVDDIMDIFNNKDPLYRQLKDMGFMDDKLIRSLYGLDNSVIKNGSAQFFDPTISKYIMEGLSNIAKKLVVDDDWVANYLEGIGAEYTAENAKIIRDLANQPGSDVYIKRKEMDTMRKELNKRIYLLSVVSDRNDRDDSEKLDEEMKKYASLAAEKKVGLEPYKKLERPEREVKPKVDTKAINVKSSTLGLTAKDLGLDKDMLAEIDNSKEVQAVSELEDKLRDELDVLNQISSVKQQLNDMGVDTSEYEAMAESDKDQLEMLKTRLVLEKDAAKDEEEKKKKAQEQRALVKETANAMSASFSEASSALSQFAEQSEEAAIASKSLLIASAIAKLVAQFAQIPKGTEIWSWIAGTVAGTATLVATVATLKSFQTGGIVHGKGTAYSDSIPIMVSDGEMMLNPLQQTHLFDILNHPGYLGGGTPTLRTRITGNNIDFILDTNERFKSKLL